MTKKEYSTLYFIVPYDQTEKYRSAIDRADWDDDVRIDNDVNGTHL